MLFFFGTRASKIGERNIQGNTTCPYCENKNTFTAVTFGRYFHLFWIPLFPFSKTTVLECSHCKKTYTEKEVPENIKRALDNDRRLNPVKRPIWHGCGCLILAVLAVVIFSLSLFGVFTADSDDFEEDARSSYLQDDINSAITNPTREQDSIAYMLKTCINYEIEGVNTEGYKYYTEANNDKLLVLLKVDNMQKVEKESRKELVFAVEDCLNAINLTSIKDYYIGIDGNWNLLMAKTPTDQDLGGKYADRALLYPFYGDEEVKQDSLN